MSKNTTGRGATGRIRPINKKLTAKLMAKRAMLLEVSKLAGRSHGLRAVAGEIAGKAQITAEEKMGAWVRGNRAVRGNAKGAASDRREVKSIERYVEKRRKEGFASVEERAESIRRMVSRSESLAGRKLGRAAMAAAKASRQLATCRIVAVPVIMPKGKAPKVKAPKGKAPKVKTPKVKTPTVKKAA